MTFQGAGFLDTTGRFTFAPGGLVPKGLREWYVDNNFTGATSDGSQNNPFTTIQAAVDAAMAQGPAGAFHAIHVKPGATYAEGHMVIGTPNPAFPFTEPAFLGAIIGPDPAGDLLGSPIAQRSVIIDGQIDIGAASSLALLNIAVESNAPVAGLSQVALVHGQLMAKNCNFDSRFIDAGLPIINLGNQAGSAFVAEPDTGQFRNLSLEECLVSNGALTGETALGGALVNDGASPQEHVVLSNVAVETPAGVAGSLALNLTGGAGAADHGIFRFSNCSFGYPEVISPGAGVVGNQSLVSRYDDCKFHNCSFRAGRAVVARAAATTPLVALRDVHLLAESNAGGLELFNNLFVEMNTTNAINHTPGDVVVAFSAGAAGSAEFKWQGNVDDTGQDAFFEVRDLGTGLQSLSQLLWATFICLDGSSWNQIVDLTAAGDFQINSEAGVPAGGGRAFMLLGSGPSAPPRVYFSFDVFWHNGQTGLTRQIWSNINPNFAGAGASGDAEIQWLNTPGAYPVSPFLFDTVLVFNRSAGAEDFMYQAHGAFLAIIPLGPI